MQLDIEQTKISVVEEVVETWDLGGYVMPGGSHFVASVDGTSIEGHGFEMTRFGSTPDAAIKALFEGMTAAGVTL